MKKEQNIVEADLSLSVSCGGNLWLESLGKFVCGHQSWRRGTWLLPPVSLRSRLGLPEGTAEIEAETAEVNGSLPEQL